MTLVLLLFFPSRYTFLSVHTLALTCAVKTQQVFFSLGVGYTLIIPFQGVPGQGQAFGTWTHTLLGAQVPGSSLLGKDSGSFLLTPAGGLFRACCELTTHNLTLSCNVQVVSKECS